MLISYFKHTESFLISITTNVQLLAGWTPSHCLRFLYSVCPTQQRGHGAVGGVQIDDAVTFQVGNEQLIGALGDDALWLLQHGAGECTCDAEIAIHLDYGAGAAIGDEDITTALYGDVIWIFKYLFPGLLVVHPVYHSSIHCYRIHPK